MRRFLLALLLLACGSAFGQAAEIAATVVDEHGRPVEDAVVVAVPSDGSVRVPAHLREASVDQVDQEFTPKVTAIVVGTPVRFPNHDNIRHQVYSFSPAKRFELPLYAGVPAAAIVFDKPGVVVLGCNIHDWMIGYIYVSESPYFAKTGSDGKALLGELPLRAYRVRVWHPQLATGEETTRKTVDVERAGPVSVQWTIALKRETKIRRVPAADGRGGGY
ncbi:MAG TPA: methylamine utilization protein [Casimicrobiaceae bacterium]|nr:methylamine utilization protein [Casimicrobiaceae bacterium]